jgi:hypothetical protein
VDAIARPGDDLVRVAGARNRESVAVPRGRHDDEVVTPITEHYELLCDPEHAFDVYVNRIAEWWTPHYTHHPETFNGITIEPYVGGRVVERHSTGENHEWGRVVEWIPARHVAYTSNLAQGDGDPSTITADFIPGPDGGTSFDFAQGGWNASNEADREKFTEWRIILDRYAQLADATDATDAPDTTTPGPGRP